jgi:hypothetical protein
MDIPVLIITYNRFDFVLRILKELNDHGYRNVYISVDDYYHDTIGFKKVEDFLQEHNFLHKILKWSTNIGCENNVLDGIKWFFTNVEKGVILEDDCIPKEGFFSLLGKVRELNIDEENISFFSDNIGSHPGFYVRPSHIPFFWGWYSSKAFFDDFYSFIKTNSLSLAQIKKVLSSRLSFKIKLISLINYLSFSNDTGGTGWDSVMFFYLIIKGRPFYVPSHSLVDNVGFGYMNSSFTHTDQMPDWCRNIAQKSNDVSGCPKVYESDEKLNNEFLNIFFEEYPGSVKLFSTFIIKLFQNKIKRKASNRYNSDRTSLSKI